MNKKDKLYYGGFASIIIAIVFMVIETILTSKKIALLQSATTEHIDYTYSVNANPYLLGCIVIFGLVGFILVAYNYEEDREGVD